MRLDFPKRVPGEVEFGIIYGGIALLVLAAAWLPQLTAFAPECVFKGLTGIPCPTCGSTRSVVHLAHGDIIAAFIMNPLAALFMIAAIASFFLNLITLIFGLPRFIVIFTEKEKNAMRVGMAMLLLAHWGYLAATH